EVISGDVLLVDVRTRPEYEKGFIEGAVNIDFKKSDFEKRMGHFDREMPVAVYCAKGGRSAEAAKKLQDMGFAKVYDLKGGYTAWTTK
ncbi:MAG: rhodanese-like domain-containing protein, partial [Bacteroidota bacterium]